MTLTEDQKYSLDFLSECFKESLKYIEEIKKGSDIEMNISYLTHDWTSLNDTMDRQNEDIIKHLERINTIKENKTDDF